MRRNPKSIVDDTRRALTRLLRSGDLYVGKGPVAEGEFDDIRIATGNENITLWLNEAAWLRDGLTDILDGRRDEAGRGVFEGRGDAPQATL